MRFSFRVSLLSSVGEAIVDSLLVSPTAFVSQFYHQTHMLRSATGHMYRNDFLQFLSVLTMFLLVLCFPFWKSVSATRPLVYGCSGRSRSSPFGSLTRVPRGRRGSLWLSFLFCYHSGFSDCDCRTSCLWYFGQCYCG